MTKISETTNVEDKFDEFRAFLAGCRSRREMSLGRAKWDSWAINRAANGDSRFRVGGELAKKMGDMWDARKKQLMSIDSLFSAESALRKAAMDYAMGPTPDTEKSLRTAANRFSAVFNFFDGQPAEEDPAPPREIVP